MGMYRNIALDNDGDSQNEITSSAMRLKELVAVNNNAVAGCYVHLYKKASADVSPGTTVPDATFYIANLGGTIQLRPDEYSHDGWTVCGSDNADGSGSSISSVRVYAATV